MINQISARVYPNVIRKVPVKPATVLPVVAVPIVAYISQNQINKMRKTTIDEELQKSKILHSSHHAVKDRTDYNISQLKKANISEKDAKNYLDKDGFMNNKGKDICQSKGITSFKGNNTTETDIYGDIDTNTSVDMLSEHIDTASDFTDSVSDTADTISDAADSFSDVADAASDSIDTVSDFAQTVMTTGVAAEAVAGAVSVAAGEVAPIVKFVKPIKDFVKGDFKKAGIGAVTRVVEIPLLPGKVLLGTIVGIGNGFANRDDGKSFGKGFVEAFTGVLNGCANARDDIENSILGRETKSEKKERLLREAQEMREKAKKEAQRITEEKKQKLIRERQEQERQVQIEAEKRKEEQYRQDRRTISRMTNRKELNQQRAEFEALYDEYKRLKAGSNVTEFKNWESWNSHQFTHNTEIIQGLIKRERNKGTKTWYTPSQRSLQVEAEKQKIREQQEQELKKKREIAERRELERQNYLEKQASRCDKPTDAYHQSLYEFEDIMEEYRLLRPDKNLSNYKNYEGWDMSQLDKNTEILKSKIAKIKSRPFWD